MRILVDGDACPVKEILIEIAKEYELEVQIFFDSAHIYENDYAKVIICDKGADSVDYVLLKELKKEDIVITNDYGLSALALTKLAYVVSFSGLVINNDNIDGLLNSRYMSAKARKADKHIKGPSKRTKHMDESFHFSLVRVINENSN